MSLAALALATGAITGLSTAANAGGKSGTTHGCYAQWWSTAFAAKCQNATKNLWPVYVYGDCAFELDWEDGPFSIEKGYTGTFDSNECMISVNRAYLLFS